MSGSFTATEATGGRLKQARRSLMSGGLVQEAAEGHAAALALPNSIKAYTSASASVTSTDGRNTASARPETMCKSQWSG